MDNTIIPYQDTNETSEEELDDSSSDDEHSHLLSNNIGVLYNQFIANETFMNMENQQQYQKNRNKLFTPEIIKKYFTIDLTLTTTVKLLNDNFHLYKLNINLQNNLLFLLNDFNLNKYKCTDHKKLYKFLMNGI